MSACNVLLSVSSPYVPMLDLIPSLVDPILTTFPANSLVEGGSICKWYQLVYTP